MRWLALVLPAIAATPLDDVEVARLDALAREGRLRPPGCHRMYGSGDGSADLGVFGTHAITWTTRGTLRDGVWEAREIATPALPDWAPAEDRAIPAFGTVPDVAADRGGFQFLLHALPGAVSAMYATTKGDTTELVASLRGGPRSDNHMTTIFDAATSRPRAWTMSVTSPVVLRDGARSVTVRRLSVRLDADAAGVPVREVADAAFSKGPFSGELRFRTEWTTRPC